MIGNDVVDLGDPAFAEPAIHRRFDARVFSRGERQRLAASGARHRLRWMLWAAKEAAYKLARKRDPLLRFSPRQFAVELGPDLRGRVCGREACYDLRVKVAGPWVHAVASDAPLGLVDGARVARIADDGVAGSARRAVRELACSALAQQLGLERAQLSIRSERRIPQLEIGGRRSQVDLSLSHHGRFVACAWQAGSALAGASGGRPLGGGPEPAVPHA